MAGFFKHGNELMNFRVQKGQGISWQTERLLESQEKLNSMEVVRQIIIILTGLLYGCETWSLTLKDEHKVFEKRLLSKTWRALYLPLYNLMKWCLGTGACLPVLHNFLCVQGTLKRRDHLKESKFFDCTCARCSDATELGTYAGALKCPQCDTGVVISTAPLNRDADWCCTNDACTGYTVPAHSVRLLMDKWDEFSLFYLCFTNVRQVKVSSFSIKNSQCCLLGCYLSQCHCKGRT